MSPEAEAELEYVLGVALRRFEIRATEVTFERKQKGTAFIIWDRRLAHAPAQVFASTSLTDARDMLVRLQTEAILQLIKELAPDARAAD